MTEDSSIVYGSIRTTISEPIQRVEPFQFPGYDRGITYGGSFTNRPLVSATFVQNPLAAPITVVVSRSANINTISI